MAPLISPRSLAPSLFLLFSISFGGKELYTKLCAVCHGEDRLGKTAPPLIPQTLEGKSEDYLERVIREGIPFTNMPPFELTEEEIKSLISYIRSPLPEVEFSPSEGKELKRERANYRIGDPKNLVVFVDKKNGKVVLLEGPKVLDSFSFRNVHGGVKFSSKGFYVPSRDGRVLFYSFEERRPKLVARPCLYLRNIAFSKGVLAVACTLPRSLLLMSEDLKILKAIELKGDPAGVYPYKDRFLLTFKDEPFVAFVGRDSKVRYVKVEEPIVDFFVDPLEKFLVGSPRKEGKVFVYSLPEMKKVTSFETGSLPHLFSSTFWYSKGKFYFATRHVGTGKVTLWELYSWRKVKEIDVGKRGFFVRTHPSTPYLWVDGGEGELVLVDKRTFEVRKVKTGRGGRVTHVEFSGDGKLAYISLLGEGLSVVDSQTFRELAFLRTEKPSGKYNTLMKTKEGLAYLLGYEVFMEKCWGCHHPTKQAFGPPMRWIATHRERELIVSQILNPKATSKLLGYRRNNMPKIELSEEEVEALLRFMEFLKEGRHERTPEAGEQGKQAYSR